jgi:chromosomal replication initiator protein
VRDAELLTSEDGAYVVGVQNAYARDWLESRLQSQIQRVLSSRAGRTVEVRFVVWQGEPAAAPALTPPAGTGPLGAGHSLLNPRYTFESFVVGPSRPGRGRKPRPGLQPALGLRRRRPG